MTATEVQYNGHTNGGLNGRASSAAMLKQGASSNALLTFRQAPHNLEAEQALLGAILVNNEVLDRVSGFLSPDHFFDPLHARIFETLATLIHAGKTATPITVKTFFENVEIRPGITVAQYLGTLVANATTTMCAAEYGNMIYDLATRRLLAVIGEDIAASAYDSSVDAAPDHLIAIAAEKLGDVAAISRAFQPNDLLMFAHEANIEPSGLYLVKHLLNSSSIAALYGPSTLGKTFYALDLAFHIALGMALRGRRVKQSPVLYVVLEGQADFPKRVTAARKEYGEPGKMFAILKVPISLGANATGDASVTTIIKAVRALEAATGKTVGLIIIDTLARAMSGDNENEAQAISGFLTKIDRIRAVTSAAVLLIHHPGKNAALGMRGSSSLFAAMDVVIRIDGDKEAAERSVVIEKAKDGIEGPLETYTLKSVSLGVDEDGDEITSCVIEPTQRTTAKTRRRPAASTGAAKALNELEHLLIDGKCSQSKAHARIPNGTKTIERDAFRLACRTKGLTATRTADAEKQAFNRAFRELEAGGWLGSHEKSVWLIGDTLGGVSNNE